MQRHEADARNARATCERCRRPQVVCYCAHIPSLPTHNRVLLLQHPREQWTAIGTARMAHLALSGSTLRIGLDFSDDPLVKAAIAERAYVLFPGEGAIAPEDLPPGPPITLVVVDGTWSQAQKLLRLNPAIAALPRIGLSPTRPSEYAIRRQPAEFCVSTIEALAEVLPALEGAARFEVLRDPFRAMVAMQMRFRDEVHSSRHQKERKRRPNGLQRLSAKLKAVAPRIVCVQGDANGWARNDPNRKPAESVMWKAMRMVDGASFSMVIAPQRVLAPATIDHVGLSELELRAGSDRAAWCSAWNDFIRPDDVLVHWGRFYVDLAETEGLRLPAERIDLRPEMTQAFRERTATAEGGAVRLGGSPPSSYTDVLRASRRLKAVQFIAHALCTMSNFMP